MKAVRIGVGFAAIVSISPLAAAAPKLDQLRNGHDMLIVSAPAHINALTDQRRAWEEWRRSAQERDVIIVYLDGGKVEWESDTAASVRAWYKIPAKVFSVALIGKDGRLVYRSSKPVSGLEFEATIDAMPMRRAGQR